MSISPQARFWKYILRRKFKKSSLTPAQLRAQSAKNAVYPGRKPAGLAVERVDIGIPAAWIRPLGADAKKVIVHLHGGGFVTGSADSYLTMCIPMAETLKTNILLPEYRLAPEHPFPAALNDVVAVFQWLIESGFHARDIVISGDSAGGGLALALVQKLRDAGEELPPAIVCMSPWLDLTLSGSSHAENSETDPLLRTETLKAWAELYAAGENQANPLISPLFADFSGFPPILIQAGSDEILLSDALEFAAKARAQGANLTLKVWDGMWHVWHVLGVLVPESALAFEEIGEFLECLKKPGHGEP